jgi:hypothetical protein
MNLEMRRVSGLIVLSFALFSATFLLAGQPKSASHSNDQTFTGEIMDSLCAKDGTHQEMMEQMKSMGNDKKTCAMKCAQLGSKYVLYDSAKKTIYNLDDQDKAEGFAGRNVRVSGTIQKNKIKVEGIEAAE